jgi:acyl carrier protein
MSIPTGIGRCPICLNAALLELVEPDNTALCPECGFVLRWFRNRFAGIKQLLITGQTSFMEALGMDSLDIVEFITDLEEEFDVAVPEDADERFITVGDIIRYIVQCCRATEATVSSDENE